MAAQFRDYYEVLQVPRTVSEEDIKKAYHRLARKHHPDLNPPKDKPLHTQRMQEINEAYSVLSSKESRAKYDQFGKNWKDGAPGQQEQETGRQPGQTDEAFSDFFRNMFRQREERGESEELFPSELDIEAVLELSLGDAVQGADRSFSVMTSGICPNCRGTGRKGKAICPVCGGVGEVRRQREVKTKIPPGLLDGSRIRLRGQGNEGASGHGDLYLRIHLVPNPNFKVDGINLETALRVMPWQAALGSTVKVEALEGPLHMRLPKGTHTGAKLRLAQKGLGKPGERGDLLVRIEIDIPDSLTPEAEALLKKWEEEANA